jgi:hypothetical protein
MADDMGKLKAHLQKLAKRNCWTDGVDFNPYEQSGGNFDDAYYRGNEDGETLLARELLERFFPSA